MMSLQKFQTIHHPCFPCASHQLGISRNLHNPSRASFLVRSHQVPSALASSSPDQPQRRQLLAMGAFICPLLMSMQTKTSFAAETKTKGYLSVTDNKDGYSFLYPFGWQEVVVEGQDKVFKDVVEPLENVSVNVIPTTKQNIRDFGSPQQVAETLLKEVLASSQKTKLLEVTERDAEGKTYYAFEFITQAPNFTRHALASVCIGNGKFYTLTTGANERRWQKMKDRLHTVVNSFQIFNV